MFGFEKLLTTMPCTYLLLHQGISTAVKARSFRYLFESTVPNFSWKILVRNLSDRRYAADYARYGTSSCRKCKVKLGKGSFRLAKFVYNPFSISTSMKQYFHPECLFNTFNFSKKIEDTDDIEGFDCLKRKDQELIKRFLKAPSIEKEKKAKKPSTVKKQAGHSVEEKAAAVTTVVVDYDDKGPGDDNEDNSFRQFQRLCSTLVDESGHTAKSNIISDFLKNGSAGLGGFLGNTYLLMKLLLPCITKIVYNLDNKQIIKLFSRIFGTDPAEMMEDVTRGDVSETVAMYFASNGKLPPAGSSTLTLHQVDVMLTELSKRRKEGDQVAVLTEIARRCTVDDLKMIIRLIKCDLRINTGARVILDGLHSSAYKAFQASCDLRDVVSRVERVVGDASGLERELDIRLSLMTPILPMLAKPCKSVENLLASYPDGVFAELKYDGERVQLHKQGSRFKYFSRNLKEVAPHKVKFFEEHILKAFQHGKDLILDCEMVVIDRRSNRPLPFGTLGRLKMEECNNTNAALFIFDCLYYNGKNLMDRPIWERRSTMLESMKEIDHRVLLSEMKHITLPAELQEVLSIVFAGGEEGVILKDVNSRYEPGRRHWVKVKRDHLQVAGMADSVDLVLLGANFGSGRKGGTMSSFLMGVYDPASSKFCTVTRCASGLDGEMLKELNRSLKMVKINRDVNCVPAWLSVNKTIVPDFVVDNPKKSSVWEVIGAEFTKSSKHTSDGISIRFPRFAKLRPDKTWKEATKLDELKVLYETSSEKKDFCHRRIWGDAAGGHLLQD